MADGTCIHPDGCDRPAYVSAGWCRMHWRRIKETGSPGPAGRIRREANQRCEREGCDLKAWAKGLCKKHYAQALYVPRNQDVVHITFKQCAWESCETFFVIAGPKKNTRQTYCAEHQPKAEDAVRGRYKRSEAGKAQRARQSVAKFGISWQQYQRMEVEQDFKCAICGTEENGRYSRFAVDHDHKCCPGKESCGKCVRGLLCDRCNRAIGMFGDDVELIEKALAYLKKYA